MFRPGTGEPPGTSVVAIEKSIELTSGSTVRRIESSSRTTGRNESRTPKSLNCVEEVPPPPDAPDPTPENDGTGNWPPARNWAWWPFSAISSGSARTFSRLFRRSAVSTVLKAPWPKVPNAVACDPRPRVELFGVIVTLRIARENWVAGVMSTVGEGNAPAPRTPEKPLPAICEPNSVCAPGISARKSAPIWRNAVRFSSATRTLSITCCEVGTRIRLMTCD